MRVRDWASRYKTSYEIEGITLATPRGFVLERYQRKHPLYDRFLPVLAAHLPSGSTVVDVGANIGDSLAGMIGATDLNFLCYEPSPKFFAYLQSNVKIMPAQERINISPFFIGTGVAKGTLTYSHAGTARLDTVQVDNHIEFHALDTLLDDESKVVLIKSDTDGFDFDVLFSAKTTLQRKQPLLFFECDFYNEDQYQGYLAFIRQIADWGYEKVCVFDNFGNLLHQFLEIERLHELLDYQYNVKFRTGTKALFYVDILAVAPNHFETANKAIQGFKSKYHLI